MKVLSIDCRMAQSSGIGVYIRNLVPRCMRLMPDTKFRLLGYDSDFAIPPGTHWEAKNFKAAIYSIEEQICYGKVLAGSDALWVPHFNIPLFCKIPLATTIHDFAPLALKDAFSLSKRLYARLFLSRISKIAKEIFMISQFTNTEFERFVGQTKANVNVIYNGVDDLWFDSPINMSQTHPGDYFLSIGNIKPHKNIPLLCRAYAKIAASCSADLVIVGEWQGFRSRQVDVESLMALCPGRIHFPGVVTDSTLFNLLSGAKALIFPSTYEGFGLPPLEALACKVPVVASCIPPVQEVCGSNAIYFQPQDENELSVRLLEVLKLNSKEKEIITETGQRQAKKFSWDKTSRFVAERLYRLF